METKINKYHTSKIYKISSSQCEKFYIGSTTQILKRRLAGHKSHYKHYIEKGFGRCITSFEIVKFDDCIIELIKNVKCENKKELERIEGECILEHHNRILNKIVAGRTQKEWQEANKDRIKEQKKQYHEANKEHLKNTKNEYYELHKEHLYNKKKEWIELNKEKLYEKLYEKFDCDCGGKYTFKHKATHNKTKQHQLFISNQS